MCLYVLICAHLVHTLLFINSFDFICVIYTLTMLCFALSGYINALSSAHLLRLCSLPMFAHVLWFAPICFSFAMLWFAPFPSTLLLSFPMIIILCPPHYPIFLPLLGLVCYDWLLTACLFLSVCCSFIICINFNFVVFIQFLCWDILISSRCL